MTGGVTVVLGGQAGSEGKGKIVGYLALRDNFDIAVCNFMPNAGHTWVSDDGEKVMVQQLPMAVVNPKTELYISAGAAIDPDILKRELEAHPDAAHRLHIHPRAVVIEQHHRDIEAEVLTRISSTTKGCGAALADKVMRTDHVMLAGDHDFLREFVDWSFSEGLLSALRDGASILVEGAQGFDLDINHGLEYPYCTSRQTITCQLLADAGLPPQSVEEVIAVIRSYPIRVGNNYDEQGRLIGYSGPYNTPEITWEEVARRAGAPMDAIKEYTTVTGKLRRVFEMSWTRLEKMCAINGVTQIALNFANYIDWSILGANKEEQLTDKVWDFIHKVQATTGVEVTLVGTGPKNSDIVDLRF